MSDDPGDHGAADPTLRAALAQGEVVAIRRSFLAARVLVPVVTAAPGNASGQHEAEMAVPRLVAADGRHALPVFSSYDAMRAWRPEARPVPMTGEQAVLGALSEGYAALVIDVAGPVTHSIEIGPGEEGVHAAIV